jgi:hypothetical protein
MLEFLLTANAEPLEIMGHRQESLDSIQMKFSQKARANPVSPFLDKPR